MARYAIAQEQQYHHKANVTPGTRRSVLMLRAIALASGYRRLRHDEQKAGVTVYARAFTLYFRRCFATPLRHAQPRDVAA